VSAIAAHRMRPRILSGALTGLWQLIDIVNRTCTDRQSASRQDCLTPRRVLAVPRQIAADPGACIRPAEAERTETDKSRSHRSGNRFVQRQIPMARHGLARAWRKGGTWSLQPVAIRAP